MGIHRWLFRIEILIIADFFGNLFFLSRTPNTHLLRGKNLLLYLRRGFILVQNKCRGISLLINLWCMLVQFFLQLYFHLLLIFNCFRSFATRGLISFRFRLINSFNLILLWGSRGLLVILSNCAWFFLTNLFLTSISEQTDGLLASRRPAILSTHASLPTFTLINTSPIINKRMISYSFTKDS